MHGVLAPVVLALLVFSLLLLAAVLVSERASRSVLSTSVLFLVTGFAAGDGVLGLVRVQGGDAAVKRVAEVALFAVLLTDGMRVGIGDLRGAWRLPGRALFVGLPLTVLTIAALGRWVAGLPWPVAFLVAAALSPTDPVLASAIVGREAVPRRVRHLLNVESGLNDGLALPIVLVMLALLGGAGTSADTLVEETVLGVLVGVALPLAAAWLERRERLAAAPSYQPLLAFAVGLAVFAVTQLLHANEFLAAFAAGIALASANAKAREEFASFGEPLVELLKLGALLLFGTLLSPAVFADLGLADYAFALLVLVVARPLALAMALVGSPLGWREWTSVAWFGPKGFASVVYAILILQSGVAGAEHLFHLMAVVIAASILAHSSTDVLIARWHAAQPETAREGG